jgi:excisionase family DNA binding protein
MSEAPYVPVEELAKQLTVSISCIRGWIRQGKVPKHTYIKVGNTYRFNIPMVIAALTKIPDPEAKPADAVVEVSSIPVPVQLELNFNPDHDL